MESNSDMQMENLSDIKRKLQIVVPAKEVTAEFNRIYKDLGKRVKVKGFRPGKVPHSVLEMYYKKEIQDEVSDALVRRSLEERPEGEVPGGHGLELARASAAGGGGGGLPLPGGSGDPPRIYRRGLPGPDPGGPGGRGHR